VTQSVAKIVQMADPATPASQSPCFETRHFTVQELAKIWNLSDDTLRVIFEREPGVVAIDRPRTTRKHRYLTLRIPQDVAERVYRRLQRL
jgi:hypothetical protein